MLQPNRNIDLSLWNVSSGSESVENIETQPKLHLMAPNVCSFEFAPIAQNDIIEISAVENYDTVWIRSTKSDTKFDEMMRKINGDNFDDGPATDARIDEVLLVKYCGDFCRGIVVSNLEKENAYTIQLMDIGGIIDANKCKFY